MPDRTREISSPSPTVLARPDHNWGLLREMPVMMIPKVQRERYVMPLHRQ